MASDTTTGARGPYAKTAAVRQRILEAGMQCFAQVGYFATSLNDIADRAGISRRGLGHHFKSKEELLTEVLDPRPTDQFRLSSRMRQEMLRPQVNLKEGEKIDGADSWALGWAIQKRKTGDVILHSGGQDGFRSLTMGSVARKSGFVMFTNGDNGGKVIFHPRLATVLDSLLVS